MEDLFRHLNSFGGVFLLGVQDSIEVTGEVPNADLMVQDIWNTLNKNEPNVRL